MSTASVDDNGRGLALTALLCSPIRPRAPAQPGDARSLSLLQPRHRRLANRRGVRHRHWYRALTLRPTTACSYASSPTTAPRRRDQRRHQDAVGGERLRTASRLGEPSRLRLRLDLSAARHAKGTVFYIGGTPATFEAQRHIAMAVQLPPKCPPSCRYCPKAVTQQTTLNPDPEIF